MPPLVQVAASASPNALALAGNRSSAAASSAGESKEPAFSNHLKAQQRGNQNKASDNATEEAETAEKPTLAASTSKRASPDKGHDHVASQAADKGYAVGGNARKDASEASSQTREKDDVLTSRGLQNASAKDLENQARDTPLVTMGEQVGASLTVDDAANFESSTTNNSPVASLVIAVSGNELPPEDGLLPQRAAELVSESLAEESVETAPVLFEPGGGELELPPVDGETLAVTVQQIAAELNPAQVASALHQERVKATDTEGVSPAQAGEFSARPNSALLSVAPERAHNLGRTEKALLREGSAPKLPATTQLMANALSNDSGPKDNFEQVRQNIMAALAGKSEIPSPATLAVPGEGHESRETAAQGLNFSNVSASLLATGAESAKYTAAQESTPPRFFTLQTPAGQPGWDVEVGNRIRWMVGQNNTGVELRLNPPELGSIEVKVATEGERTSVTFFAANPAAREALELALPRLREMFADSGMQLANADVSDQGLQQERERLSGSERLSAGSNKGEAMISEAGSGLISGEPAEGRGIIDYYI